MSEKEFSLVSMSKIVGGFFVLNMSWTMLLFLMLIQTSTAEEQIAIQKTKTNIEIIQKLLQMSTEQIINRSNIRSSDSINVHFDNLEDCLIAQQAITSKLKLSGYSIFYCDDTSKKNRVLFDINHVGLHVRYEDMFRDGIFGSKKVKRTISSVMSIQVVNKQSGELLYSDLVTNQSTDTVDVDEIPNLERESTKCAHAEIPKDDFVDRMVEPFVIIGATGVAIFLFFHIRTQ